MPFLQSLTSKQEMRYVSSISDLYGPLSSSSINGSYWFALNGFLLKKYFVKIVSLILSVRLLWTMAIVVFGEETCLKILIFS